MKKSFPSYAYWGLCGLLSIGILKASGGFKKLYSFTHSLDIHGDEASIKKQGEKIMRDDSRKRADAKYWKEYYERQAREKKKKEDREKKDAAEAKRQKEEAKKAFEEDKRDQARRS